MPQFKYQGRDAQGHPVSGIRESESADNIGKQLITEGITPVTITQIKYSTSWRDLFPSFQSVTSEELLIFCQQMSALLQAGIPLIMALQRISDTIKNKKFKQLIRQVTQAVAEGTTLSKALEAHPRYFTPIMCNLIHVGEESGNLVEIFRQLVDYLSFEDLTKKRILTALRYPTSVFLVIIVAITIINVFVIPVFARLYEGFHVALPLPTRIIIGFSNFTRHYGIDVIIILITAGILFRFYAKTDAWKYGYGKAILKMPLFGELIKRMLLARFARTLGLVYQSGIPLIAGLRLVADSNTNLYVKKTLLQLRDYLTQGESLSAAAVKTPLFSPIIIQMLSVGEETGALDNILFQVATYYETTIDYDVKRLSDRMEPILLITVGGIVLILALGVFLPMWNIINLVKT